MATRSSHAGSRSGMLAMLAMLACVFNRWPLGAFVGYVGYLFLIANIANITRGLFCRAICWLLCWHYVGNPKTRVQPAWGLRFGGLLAMLAICFAGSTALPHSYIQYIAL